MSIVPIPTTPTRRRLLLASAVAAGASAFGLPAAHAVSFRDIAGSPFAKEIRWMADRGLSRGWPDGTYRPLQPIARDAFAAFLYRLEGEPAFTPPDVTPFRDVPETSQFYTEITWARARGLVTGWPDGTFKPLSPIARDAAVAIFYRLAKKPATAAFAPYRDVPSGAMFRTEIGWARNTGLMLGWSDGTFRPRAPIARDAMAALVYRYVNGGVFGKGVRVEGAIATAYWAANGTFGSLGLPTGNARKVRSGATRKNGLQQDFAGGAITDVAGIGARRSSGGLLAEWKSAGAVGGKLGFPRTNPYSWGAGYRQDFEGGLRTWYSGWNPSESVHGPILVTTAVRGGVPLRRGWNGTRVRIVQRKLGISRSGSGQTYDYATEQAVRAFQRRNKLTADGVVGPATWKKLAPEYPFTMDAWRTPVRVKAAATRAQRVEEMIRFAQSCKGAPYTWGGAGWSNHSVAGYDCSGLVLQALYSAGLDPQPINVVRHAEPTYRTSQMLYGDKKLATKKLAERQRGDLIFWADSGGVVRHVAIYLGGGRIIEANVSSTYGTNVHERPYAANLRSTRFVRPFIKRPFV